MIKANLNGIKIAAITCAVPKAIDDLSKYRESFGDKAIEEFSNMTGVKERHIAKEEQTSSDLVFVAAKNLINREQIDVSEIGACIFVTQTPDYRIPATACVLHKRLGLPVDCIAFDVNLGCSGYVYGLNIAASIMKTNEIDKCLFLVGDTSNKDISDEDKSACMLFGDAAAATLLIKDSTSIMSGVYRTDGNDFKAIITPSGAYRNRNAKKERTLWSDGNQRSDYELYMNGTDVFTFTISEVPKLIKEYIVEQGKTIGEFDSFIMHQANCYILKQVAKKSKIPIEKIPISMDRYGNTSVTSIPLTLCDAYAASEGIVSTLMCGFGVGLSWGVVGAEIDCSHIYQIIETDESYNDGGVSHD